jgi:HPt (histidine-containing phosphotransfer) domain-containing protein
MTESPRSLSTSASLPVLDLAELRDRAGGDEELVMELLGDFLTRATEVTLITDAAQVGDYVKTSKLAHRTKGSLLALGAKAAARAASDVEHQSAMLRDGGPSEAITAQLAASLATLASRFDEACKAMRDAQSGATAVTPSLSSGWR